MLVVGILFVIASIAGGAEITRAFTSPSTFLGRLGDRFIHLLNPRKNRGVEDEALAGSIARFAGGIAVTAVMSQLQFPWNMLLFFAYYKFMTAIVFTVVPVSLALWGTYKTWTARKGFKKSLDQEKEKADSNIESDSWSDSCGDNEHLLKGHPKYFHEPKTYKREIKSLDLQKHDHATLKADCPPRERIEFHHHANYKTSSIYPSV